MSGVKFRGFMFASGQGFYGQAARPDRVASRSSSVSRLVMARRRGFGGSGPVMSARPALVKRGVGTGEEDGGGQPEVSTVA